MDDHTLECLDFPRVRDLLAGYALTSLGKRLAQSIRPQTRPEMVQRWMAQVTELRRWGAAHGMPPLAGVSDVRDLIRACAPPLRIGVEDIAAIGATLAATHEIAAYLRDVPEQEVELRHLRERIGDFQSIADRIFVVVDERAQVRDSASPKLARIRREIAEATESIRGAVERLIQDPGVRRLLQYANHTFHGDRMVLPVRTEYRGRLPGIVHRASDSGATLYVEPAVAVELNNRISNLRSEEFEEVTRLLWELAHEVFINSEALLRTVDALAVLDLIVAKCRFAEAFDLYCPAIIDDALASVRNARHPLLLEMRRQRIAAGEPSDPITPISYRLGDDFDMLIITGPNTGGKTVTLKTIGLLALMTQAGMPVPVDEGSRMGVFRSILIDIGDEQNMQQSLSTFSAHLRRQMQMLQKASPHTLVLIDELGAGTDPDEGSAIGRAILDELLASQCRCVVTTHIGALKSYPLTRARCENGCVEFDTQTLRPTYHLRIGEAGMSNAISIAQALGMPRRLIEAARNNLSGHARALHAAMEGTMSAKRAAEDARHAAELAQLKADRVENEARAAKARFEQQKADFESWVQRVVHLQPGDAVRVRHFDRDGRLVRLRLDLHRAEVDVGSFSVEAPLGDILPPETPAPPPRAARQPRPAAVPRRAQKPPGEGAAPSGAVVDANAQPPRRDSLNRGGSRDSRPPGERPAGQRPAGQRPGGQKPPDQRPPDQRRGRGGEQHGQRSGQGGERREQRPRPVIPSLTDAEAAALQPGQMIYAKRFHRDGKVTRILPAKRIAVVNVGLLEVEVPFEALAQPQGDHRERERRRPPHRPPEQSVAKRADEGQPPAS